VSTRNPSTPRSSQKRSTSYIAVRTFRVTPVEVGLLDEEGVMIVLTGRPSNSQALSPLATLSQLLGGAPSGPGHARDTSRASSYRAKCALPEPGMHVRGVIGHEVEDDANATLVQRLHQSIKVLARAENWIYVDIVATS